MMAMIRKLQRTLRDVKKSWDKFWFRPGDPTVLGVMRWLVGGMLVYTHVVWGLNLEAFFGSNGWHSTDVISVIQEGQLAPSFWWYVPDNLLYPVHYASLAVLVLFWIGLATRVTSVLAFIVTVSYCYRAHMANFGLDQINAILCLYLCIGPSGATLSVDRLLTEWWHRRRNPDAILKPAAASTTANLAIRLIQIHFCVIYACAGLSKLQGDAWWDGQATWLAFANLEYQSFDMTWIAWYPWIGELMTHTTIVWEVSFAALIWVRRIRPFVLAMGFMLHFGIGAVMGMWTFGLIMIFGHLAFWRDSWIKTLLSWPRRILRRSAPDTNHEKPTAPSLVYVDRSQQRTIDSMTYFLRRGFHCLPTDNEVEAHELCQASTTDAVVVLAGGMDDDEIEQFHDQHCEQDSGKPLFLVLNNAQSQRLNGHIRSDNSHVMAGKVSLGSLRRTIEDILDWSTDQNSVTDETKAKS